MNLEDLQLVPSPDADMKMVCAVALHYLKCLISVVVAKRT